MGYYLIEVLERAAGHEFMTEHLIQAEDKQDVKYHYHNTLRNRGYIDAPWGNKHSLQGHDGLAADLINIRSLSRQEYKVLEDVEIHNWTKL